MKPNVIATTATGGLGMGTFAPGPGIGTLARVIPEGRSIASMSRANVTSSVGLSHGAIKTAEQVRLLLYYLAYFSMDSGAFFVYIFWVIKSA